MTREQILSIVMFIASIIYIFLPTDLIPDIPGVGWIDDLLLTSTAGLNCLQQFSPENAQRVRVVFKYLKWIFLGLTVLFIIVIIILAGTIIHLLR